MIWKTIKGLFGKKTEVEPFVESPAKATGFYRTPIDWPAERELLEKNHTARLRLAVRASEITRLRRNKKKVSHLLAEQEADKAAINEGRF